MSDCGFRQLSHATKIVSSETRFFEQVSDWATKRQNLSVQLADIPSLEAAHIARRSEPYKDNPRIKLVDQGPTIRLANAFEATANGLYSIAEVAANFGNKASKGALPASFNAIRKQCESTPSSELATALGDLQWYRKVRELRTEWAHYSSTFIAENERSETIICVKSLRRPSDKVEFPSANLQVTVKEFTAWVNSALRTLDAFGEFLLDRYVVKLFDLNQTFVSGVLDQRGFPIVKEDFRFEVETITIREYLMRGGIKCEG